MLIEETPDTARLPAADHCQSAPPTGRLAQPATPTRSAAAGEDAPDQQSPVVPDPGQADEFLSAAKASALLGVKPATLYAYASRGWLQSYKQGIRRQRLYSRRELEQLLAVRADATQTGARAGAGEQPDTANMASESGASIPGQTTPGHTGDPGIEPALPEASDWVGER